MARLLEAELAKREGELAKACAAANADSCLAEEIDGWQVIEDTPPNGPAARPRKGKR